MDIYKIKLICTVLKLHHYEMDYKNIYFYWNYLWVIETGMNWYFLQWYILGHTVEPIKLIYECMGCDTLGVGALTWDYVHWF